MNGAELLVKCLKENSVDTVFGYPGSAVLPLYDALYDEKDNIRHILTGHEQGAAHAADGYARTTGKPGVCIVTSGPGATNVVTGIATALMDSVPMVVITANVPTELLGTDSFQEIDIAGITLPITKHNFIVKKAEDLYASINDAFKIASSGRRGPVLVDVTGDVLKKSLSEEEIKSFSITHGYAGIRKQIPEIEPELIKTASEMLAKAEKPLLVAGGGVIASGAEEALQKFLRKYDMPVTNTLMGKGCVSDEDILDLSLTGVHGTKASKKAVSECDVLIAVGVRFSERVTGIYRKFAPKARIIHIDIDAAEIDKNVSSYLQLRGDAKVILDKLSRELAEPVKHTAWMSEVRAYVASRDSVKRCEHLYNETFKAVSKYMKNEKQVIYTTEVGNHQMLAARELKLGKNDKFLTSGGLGTMGYGLGAAIGAQIASPDARVVHIAGDGSFRMNLTELATISRYKLPVITIVCNNHSLGMVRDIQRKKYDGRVYCTEYDDSIDLKKLAGAFGIDYYRISSPARAEKLVPEIIGKKHAVIIECAAPVRKNNK